jgi:hypothetical protein
VGSGPSGGLAMLTADPSGSYSTGSASGDNALTFALAWGERLTSELPAALEASHRFAAAARAFDRADEWHLDDTHIAASFRAMWTANASVVWAASQVERWLVRLARETGEPAPVPVPDLKTLRDALEHLDEAIFDDDNYAYANRHDARTKQRTRALERLGPFAIASWMPEGPLFNLIDPAQLNAPGRQLGDRLSSMLDVMAEDYATQEAIDRIHGK